MADQGVTTDDMVVQESRSILIIDDEPTMRQMLRQVLRGEWAVHTAADGAEAEATLAEHRVGLVLCDYMLPGESGLELVNRLRARHGVENAIVLTGTTSTEPLERAIKEGQISAYAIKPVDIHALRALLRKTLPPPSSQ